MARGKWETVNRCDQTVCMSLGDHIAKSTAAPVVNAPVTFQVVQFGGYIATPRIGDNTPRDSTGSGAPAGEGEVAMAPRVRNTVIGPVQAIMVVRLAV